MRDGVLLCTWMISHGLLIEQLFPAYLTVPNNIQQRDNVRPTTQVLQDLDLPLYLLLLDRLEHFDDTFLVVDDIDALKDFRVLSTTYKRPQYQHQILPTVPKG